MQNRIKCEEMHAVLNNTVVGTFENMYSMRMW